MKKVIVVSAVNLVEAGPLTILQECLRYLSIGLSDEYKIIALVNKKELFDFKDIEYIEFPGSKKSWLNRLYYEYFYFNKLAKHLNPFLWLSLHDITPNIKAERLAVYCHNASPFYRLSLREALMDFRFALFNVFYKYLYAINIRKNDFVIVQQNWMGRKFSDLYKTKKVIVAYPRIQQEYLEKSHDKNIARDSDFIFFYPAFPRVFKNFEVICRASELLLKQGVSNFQVVFTVLGSENYYAKYIYNSFKHIKNVKFLGIQSRDITLELYNRSDCVIFPSKLETWGIPITEAKFFKKPILLVDLEYAHETLGAYNKVKFFSPDDHIQLAVLMRDVLNKTVVFEETIENTIPASFSRDWKELFEILLN